MSTWPWVQEFLHALALELGIIRPPRHTPAERRMMRLMREAVTRHAEQQAAALRDFEFMRGEQWGRPGKSLTIRRPRS